MPTAGTPAARAPIADRTQRRWAEMMTSLAALLPSRSKCVLIDGPADQASFFAARLTDQLRTGTRRRPARVTVEADAVRDVTIFLRTVPGGRHFPVYDRVYDPGSADPGSADPGSSGPGSAEPGYAKDRGERAEQDRREHEERADIVVDLHDISWPVIRRVAAPLAARGPWYVTETRAFFACRAATWDTKFGEDLPAYCAAVAEAGIRRGGVAVDIGCGTGRALPPLRMAVGPSGTVFALDITPEMLAVARPAAAMAGAALVLADARALPFADGSVDTLFAAGLVNHLPDTTAGLSELARVTSPGGVLVLFHPSGRAALAARHGHGLSADEPLAEGRLRRSTAAAGWALTAYDDAPHRFFAVAERR